jgi:Helix-turn-helix domain
MPRAIPFAIRQTIIERRQTGHTLAAIAQEFQLSYRAVRTVWYRYRNDGDAGLQTNYAHCGAAQHRFPASLQEFACSLKRAHPRWGAGLIHLQLQKQFPAQPLPSWRTLQRWWRQAGLQSPRRRAASTQRTRGQQPHEVWELDAKERIHLQDGSWSCVLSVVDEASGALLAATTFPPTLLDPRTRHRRASLDAPGICLLGLA